MTKEFFTFTEKTPEQYSIIIVEGDNNKGFFTVPYKNKDLSLYKNRNYMIVNELSSIKHTYRWRYAVEEELETCLICGEKCKKGDLCSSLCARVYELSLDVKEQGKVVLDLKQRI